MKSVSQVWFSSALQFPVLFHALVFAGSVHLDFLRSGKIYPNSTLALHHKLAVIQSLKKIMQDPRTAASIDEVILSISILSSHEVIYTVSESRRSPFNSPLRSAQWLEVYGNISYVPEHSIALGNLLALRGGLEGIKLYGLAEIIAGGDIVSATSTLTKPNLPFMKRAILYISHVRRWAKTAHHRPTAMLGQGFQKYHYQGIMTGMIDVLDEVIDMTTGIDHYLSGRPRGLKLGAISMARTFIQYRVLALPHADEFGEIISLDDEEKNRGEGSVTFAELYEACLAAATIYNIAVIFPVPNTHRIFPHLVKRLEKALSPPYSPSVVARYGDSDSDLLLWILVLGGIAALDSDERFWFVKNLVAFVGKWKIYDWSSVEEKMQHFLWLESACSPGGKLLWEEVTKNLTWDA
jgi:hypothetical protein